MSLRLHVFPPSPRAQKVLAVAAHLRLAYEGRLVHLFQGGQNDPEFVALNPNRRMPVLWDDGFVLWEANAIAQYLAAKAPQARLGPHSVVEQAEVNRWQFWDLAHWEPAVGVLLEENLKKSIVFQQAPDPAAVIMGEKAFHACAEILELQLEGRDFIACDRLTVADFSLAAYLLHADRARMPVAPYPRLSAWRKRVLGLPAWSHSAAAGDRILTQSLPVEISPC
jgi:glutathione S-transferase